MTAVSWPGPDERPVKRAFRPTASRGIHPSTLTELWPTAAATSRSLRIQRLFSMS